MSHHTHLVEAVREHGYRMTPQRETILLVCQVCGTSVELDGAVLEPLERDLCKRYGFQVNLEQLALFGLRPACQPRKPDKKRSSKPNTR